MAVSPRVAVVGVGLIGGSLALRLVEEGIPVWAYDPDEATRASAQANGIRAVACLEDLLDTDPELIVLAGPLSAMDELARRIATRPGQAVVTDVGSVKAPVRRAMRHHGLSARYVGAHPMAGTEHSGFAAANAGLLVGAPWALTVDEETSPEALWPVLDLVRGSMRAQVRIMSDADHDHAVALVSHLPHVAATALLSVAGHDPLHAAALGLAAGSFRDGTRVGRTDPRRTEAMVTGNAPSVARAVRSMIAELDEVARGLEHGTAVTAFFDRPDPVRGMAVPKASDAVVSQIRIGDQAWQEKLIAAGSRGCVVVAADRTSGVLTLAG